MNYNIAIDGPAGAGKSTVAKLIAKKLNYIYVDTGAMYRGMAVYYINKNIDINNEELINNELDNINVEIKYIDNNQHIILNDEDITSIIRTDIVSQTASIVSKYKLVREKLVRLQQELAKKENVVMDGRDIGTVVLPNANLKIYLDASVSERANRRYLENKEKGMDADLEEIKRDIEERDYRDKNRENSPLVQADDAIYIDSSDMTIDEVVNKIISLMEV